ncbi:MAG: hypothetical protein WCR52_02000 [Bacteroidota bacterium]
MKMGVKEFLLIFKQFSKEDQIKIAEKIALQTFKDRWVLLDEVLPDTDEFSEADIVAEVNAVRYGEEETLPYSSSSSNLRG